VEKQALNIPRHTSRNRSVGDARINCVHATWVHFMGLLHVVWQIWSWWVKEMCNRSLQKFKIW